MSDEKQEEKFICEDCGFEAKSKAGLASHVRAKHPKETKGKLENIEMETIAALVSTPSQKAAAELLGINTWAVWERRKNHPVIDEVIEAIPKKALANLQQGSYKASQVLIDELGGRNRLEASKEILDRVGVSKDKKQGIAVQTKSKDGEMEVNFITYREEEE